LGHQLEPQFKNFFDIDDEEDDEEEETSANSTQSSTSTSTNSHNTSQSLTLQMTNDQMSCISSTDQVTVSFKEKCDGKSEIIKFLSLNQISSSFAKQLTINLDSSKCKSCKRNRCKIHLITLEGLLLENNAFEIEVSEFFICDSPKYIVFENVLDQTSLLQAIDSRLRVLTGTNLPFGAVKLILLTPLNRCQFNAVQRICAMVNREENAGDDSPQHLQVLLGSPGTGKSFVIQALEKIYNDVGEVLIAARLQAQGVLLQIWIWVLLLCTVLR
jgi:hypothetical protein